jgi:hypothetical protein
MAWHGMVRVCYGMEGERVDARGWYIRQAGAGDGGRGRVRSMSGVCVCAGEGWGSLHCFSRLVAVTASQYARPQRGQGSREGNPSLACHTRHQGRTRELLELHGQSTEAQNTTGQGGVRAHARRSGLLKVRGGRPVGWVWRAHHSVRLLSSRSSRIPEDDASASTWVFAPVKAAKSLWAQGWCTARGRGGSGSKTLCYSKVKYCAFANLKEWSSLCQVNLRLCDEVKQNWEIAC